MTTATIPTEHDHLCSLTVDQLKTLAGHNQVPYTGAPSKKKLADAIMAAEFLPEYPEGIPPFEQPEVDAAVAAPTIAVADLPTDNAASGDDDMRAVDGTTGNDVPGADHPQLSFDGLGERPTKSVLNIPALRLELAGKEYADGEVLHVSGFVRVDTLKFYPETIGKAAMRKVRGHSAKWVDAAERVEVTIAAE